MKLQKRADHSGDTLVVTLVGELTMSESAEFRTWIQEHLEGAPANVDVDCNGLAYIDSTGLGALVFVRKAVTARGGRLCLTRVSGWLKKFLQVTGLERTFVAPPKSGESQATPQSETKQV